MPNFLLLKDIIETKKYGKMKIRDMKNFNWQKYLKELEEINTMLLLQYNNVNEMFETFQNKFLSIIDNNAPTITLSRKESKLRQNPWLGKGILESIRIKNKLYEKYFKKKDFLRKFLVWKIWVLYKQGQYVNFIEQKKLSEKSFSKGKRQFEKTWTKTNEILNKKCNGKW